MSIVGEIYIYQVPFTDQLAKSKPRPVLVVSKENAHGDLLVLAGSSKLNSWESEAECLSIAPKDLIEGKLKEVTIFPISKQVLVSSRFLKVKVGQLKLDKLKAVFKGIAASQTKTFYESVHAPKLFKQGDTVPYAGRVFDEKEVVAGVSSMLDFWLTLGPEGAAMEKELASFLGVRSSLLVNSGSSANLVAMATLTSHKLGERRVRPGDEVITVAAGFPTTVAPIIQCGAVPVFCDVNPLTANIKVEQLEEAYVKGKTKAVMLAHALGNPFDLGEVKRFCADKGLWLIEDNCDALGSLYDGKPTGSFGDLSTQSFYPPHHITMGEGGSVNIVKEGLLKLVAESIRDWGRDCWCPSGKDNTCKKRFDQQLGELPHGYDHKYIYSHLGYNLKPLDIQAAIGREQLKKFPGFVQARINNYNFLRQQLTGMENYLDFMQPTHATAWNGAGFDWQNGKPVVQPSWFAFMMLVKPNSKFSRTDLARKLDENKIGNRMFFGGNMVRQPAFVSLKEMAQLDGRPAPFRVIGDLSGAERIMNESIFVGTYPGLKTEHLEFIAQVIKDLAK
jgi:CDP-4-dehydro-6-deoxyglucose reductase, E1